MKYGEPEAYVSHLRESCASDSGGIREISELADHPGAVIRRIRKGLPMAEFKALADWLKASDDELAPLLGISRATFHRRKKAGHLEPPESEKLIRFARLLRRATEVLESEEAAREWLRTPAVAFEGESPLSYADTEIGAREVEHLLGRIEHGVFS